MCSQCIRAELVLEAMECRLADLRRLEEERAIYVLAEAVKGVAALTDLFEVQFEIQAQHVAIDREDNVKVWLH